VSRTHSVKDGGRIELVLGQHTTVVAGDCQQRAALFSLVGSSGFVRIDDVRRSGREQRLAG
jgi:hypothetical protein